MALNYLIAFFYGSGLAVALTACGTCLLLERLKPVERSQPRYNLSLNIAYMCCAGLARFAAAPIAASVTIVTVNKLVGGLIVLPASGWGLLWALPLFVLAVDLTEYGFHRAQHAWPILWAMHSLHHSDPSFNVTTTERHFWLEPALKAVPYSVVGLLLEPSAMMLLVNFVLGLWNYIAHLNVRISLGRFAVIVNSPQYHRIHHAANPAYQNRNFAALFPVWDLLFRAMYLPNENEYPATGLDTQEVPSGLLEALAWPWRRRLRALRGAAVSG